ncbi:MAG: FecR/PupR family sigma factor regulator [Butyricimonas faecihominis]
MAISDYMEDLIYRVLAGEASVEEREEFEAWLRENDEHRVFFEKIERAWYTGKYAARWKNVGMSPHGSVEIREEQRHVGDESVEVARAWCVGWDYMACGIVGRKIPSSVVALSPW